MYDLLYGADEYKDELKKLFPTAKIEDASDEIHDNRISIELEIEEKEYWKKITLNGFIEMSLNLQMVIRDKDKCKIFEEEFQKWRETNPECFKKKE
jgi:hypothetical protein